MLCKFQLRIEMIIIIFVREKQLRTEDDDFSLLFSSMIHRHIAQMV